MTGAWPFDAVRAEVGYREDEMKKTMGARGPGRVVKARREDRGEVPPQCTGDHERVPERRPR